MPEGNFWHIKMNTNSQEQSIALITLARLYLDQPHQAVVTMLQENPMIPIWASSIHPWHQFNDAIQALTEIKSIQADQLQLFVGLGMPTAPPWGSVYLHDENLLMQASTDALLSFIKAMPVDFKPKENQPVDHFGFCLELLALLLERYSQDSEDKTLQHNIKCLLAQHLLPWSDRFLTLVDTYAQTPVYQYLAIVTRQVLAIISASFAVTAEEKSLYY